MQKSINLKDEIFVHRPLVYQRAIEDVRKLIKSRIEELEKEYTIQKRDGVLTSGYNAFTRIQELKNLLGD